MAPTSDRDYLYNRNEQYKEIALFGELTYHLTPKAQITGGARVFRYTDSNQLSVMPDLPTLKELGYDAEFYIWSGLFAPAGTPAPILQALRHAAAEAVKDPQFRTAMAAIDTPIYYLDAPEFQKFWDNDAHRLAKVVQKIGKIEEK